MDWRWKRAARPALVVGRNPVLALHSRCERRELPAVGRGAIPPRMSAMGGSSFTESDAAWPASGTSAAGAPLVGAPEQRATTRVAPTTTTLGDVVGAYKSLTTMEYTRGVRALDWPSFRGRLWQRNYYERIVRDDASLDRVRRDILDNPAQWDADRENPVAARPRDDAP